MFGPFKKEKPIMGLMGAGGGATSLANSPAAGEWSPDAPGMDGSGGVVSEYSTPTGKYRAHIFLSSVPLYVTAASTDPTAPNDVDIMAVGGGGGGGAQHGGGGGGGGMFEATSEPLSAESTYAVTVGKGGAGGAAGLYSPTGGANNTSTNGSSSSIVLSPTVTYTALGGGGGSGPGTGPFPGGSGGGGATNFGDNSNSARTPAGTTGQPGQNPGVPNLTNYGSNGGIGAAPGGTNDCGGGGGGGASAVGAAVQPTYAGPGGAGQPNVYAYGPTLAKVYGSGGGAGANAAGSPSNGGDGGSESGGAGGKGQNWSGGSYDPSMGHPGMESRGGGGGGSSNQQARSGSGGSGTVVVRYKIGTNPAPTANAGATKATGGAISFYRGKTIHAFFEPGSFVGSPTFAETCEIVAIGGGGGGGRNHGGGGGAGQYVTGTTPLSGAFTCTITIGGCYSNTNGDPSSSEPITDDNRRGGERNPDGPGGSTNPWNQQYIQGHETVMTMPGTDLTVLGGGAGGYDSPTDYIDGGGSGGGAQRDTPVGGEGGTWPGTPAYPTWTVATNDGAGPGGPTGSIGGGGGGGAGGAGAPSDGSAPGGAGGAGIELPSTFQSPQLKLAEGPNGSYWWVAGGGGGGGYTNDGGGGGGATTSDGKPFAGGGIGASPPTSPFYPYAPDVIAQNGLTGTGGGGGGGYTSGPSPASRSGMGGSGIVLVAYPS